MHLVELQYLIPDYCAFVNYCTFVYTALILYSNGGDSSSDPGARRGQGYCSCPFCTSVSVCQYVGVCTGNGL